MKIDSKRTISVSAPSASSESHLLSSIKNEVSMARVLTLKEYSMFIQLNNHLKCINL